MLIDSMSFSRMQAVLLLVSVALAAELRSVTLDEAIHLAESRAPAVRASTAARSGAEAQLNQAAAGRWPSLTLSGNLLVYDDEQTFSLISTDEPLDCATFEAVGMGDLCESFGEETVVREQVTASLTARVAVPLTGQVAIDRTIAAARSARDAGRASADAALLDARWQATDAWFAALQAERQLAIAEAQARSLTKRVETAQVAFRAGTLTRNDLLLAELALAQARQRVLQLEAARDAAYGMLGLATGSGSEPIRPDAPSDAPPREPPDADALADRAVSENPTLGAARHSAEAARASAQAASWARLPSVTAIGAWQHSEGQGVFAEPDVFYAGAQLDWTVWAWGKAAAGATASRAAAERADAQLDQLEAATRLEVRLRARALVAAGAAYDVASVSIGQAEENLRIQEKRAEAGTATMQEVLDAEAALVQAQSNQASALFEARRAEAALIRTLGFDPWA